MEIVRRIFFYTLLLSFCVFAQMTDQSEQIRIQVWAELDEFPGKFEESDVPAENNTSEAEKTEFQKLFGFSIERTKLIAPFLMEGFLYGWRFEYTPYDRTRNIEEYWSFSAVREFDSSVNRLEFHNPEPRENKLLSRVYCSRTPAQQQEFKRWTSIVHPKITGSGSASVEDGFEGIRQACSNAAKSAVREYWRTLIKNKPKEISGTLLLIQDPRIYIKNGLYMVDLDFFLETDRIVPYTYY